MNDAMPSVEVAWGDIVDRLTISRIKTRKFLEGNDKHACAKAEQDVLSECLSAASRWLPERVSAHLIDMTSSLCDVNGQLWLVEDALREHECNGTWSSQEFVMLARSVYALNDKRAAIKRNVNILLGSRIMEVKSHDLEAMPQSVGHPSSSIIMFGHIGLGDQLINFPLVVHLLSTTSKKVNVVCNRKHAATMRFLYRQLSDVVDFIWVNESSDLSPAFGADPRRLQGLVDMGYDVVLLGLHAQRCLRSAEKPEWHAFYNQLHVDPLKVLPTIRAFVCRDLDAELALMQTILTKHGIDKNQDYILVHDDASRNFILDRSVFPKDVPIITVPGEWESHNLFDFCALLEHCKEFHAFDSCYAWMVELMGLCVKRKVMHAYIKGDHDARRLFASLHPSSCCDWHDIWHR